MSENEGLIQDRVRLILGAEPDMVMFRNNIGSFIDQRGHRIKFGVGNPGGADLIGIYLGRFIAIEIKSATGKQTPEQRDFQALVERKGGIYALVRSADEARALLVQLKKDHEP